MKIYTKTGDDGTTGLFGGARVKKNHRRVAAYGEVDELNSVLGVVRTARIEEDLDRLLGGIQNTLFDIGSELAVVPGKEEKLQLPCIDDRVVETLEQAIDRYQSDLPELRNFILPGGTEAAARLHWARTACRRVERGLVGLMDETSVRPVILRYFNRLSDLLFVLARAANHRAGIADTPWTHL